MKNKKLSQSSRKWLTRQQKDQYAKKAKKDGSPSRAIFKLEEIAKHINNHQSRKNLKLSSKEQAKEAKKFKFLQPKDIVVDLGVSTCTCK
jgi:23S rRNA U2552 (ribose-2'-O)-methylase RlmE/FtsJ